MSKLELAVALHDMRMDFRYLESLLVASRKQLGM